MANLLDKTYSLKGMEPSIEAMALVDDMFDTIFAMLRESAIGGENSSTLVLDTSLFSEGDLLYVSDGVGTLSGLAVSTSAGTFLRSDGSLPEWSALTLPNAATTGDLLYANATNAIVALADVATGNALISGGVGVAPSWGKVGLTTHITGTLALANGGTGLSVVASGAIIKSTGTAFAALAPGTSNRFLQGVGSTLVWAASNYALPQTVAAGDMLYASSTTVVTVLNIGTSGKVARSNGTSPTWSTFTIPDTFAQGDLLYASATDVLTALAKNASSTRYLSNTGASNDPAWAQVDLTNGVTGTLPVGNGGTGATSLTWSSFSLTLTASVTNPTIGNGTLSGRYIQIGKLVVFNISWTFGSTSTAGDGTYIFALPVTASGAGYTFAANLLDSGTRRYGLAGFLHSTTQLRCVQLDASGSTLTHNSPIIWATGDGVVITGMYEAA